jgi:hypothetical protein
MKMKTNNAWFVMTLLLPTLVMAGNPSAESMAVKANGKGGGQLVGGKNADGVPVEVTLSDQHPYETEIKEFIRNSELPAGLKAEMIYDLEHTKIYYSSETITYQDLVSKLVMVLDSITKKTVKDGDHEVVAVEENYKRASELTYHDIFIDTSAVKYNDTSTARVSAYTRQNPREVIYFTFHTGAPGENSNDATLKKARVETVFHEQAHRLAHYLGKENLFKNERFVMGWAQLMTSYFLKLKNINEIKTALIRSGLPMEWLSSTPHFRDEENIQSSEYTSRDDSFDRKNERNLFSATKTIHVRGNQIIWHGPEKSYYEIQLDSSVFTEHPQFQDQKGPWVVKIERLDIGPRVRFLQELIDEMQQTSQPFLLDLNVNFYKINEQTEFEKSRKTKFQILGMKLDFSQLVKSWETILKKHPFITQVEYLDPVLVGHPDRQAKMESFVLRLNTLLQMLSVKNPSAYEFLKSCCSHYRIKFTYSSNPAGRAEYERNFDTHINREVGQSIWNYQINIQSTDWSDEQILKPFIDRTLLLDDGLRFQFESAAKNLGKVLFNGRAEFGMAYQYSATDKQGKRRLDAVENFFSKHTEVTDKLLCVANALKGKLGIFVIPKAKDGDEIKGVVTGPLSITHNPPYSDRTQYEQYGRLRRFFSEDPIYVFGMWVNLEHLEKNSDSLAQYIVNVATTSKVLDWDFYFTKKNGYRQIEEAKWNNVDNKFELGTDFSILGGQSGNSAPKWFNDLETAFNQCR